MFRRGPLALACLPAEIRNAQIRPKKPHISPNTSENGLDYSQPCAERCRRTLLDQVVITDPVASERTSNKPQLPPIKAYWRWRLELTVSAGASVVGTGR
jgi:hypothetical protein